MSIARDLDKTGLYELRTSLMEGRALNLIETSLLLTMIGDDEDTAKIFEIIKSRSNLGLLKEEPAVQDAIEIINRRLSGDRSIIQFKSKAPRTMLYGPCINATIHGESGTDYTAEIITDVQDIVTNNPDILNIQKRCAAENPKEEISSLYCLMETNDVKLIHNTFTATLASDKTKPTETFDSVQSLLSSIETDTGFVVRTSDYTIVVYSKGEQVFAKTTTSTSKEFKDTDPTIFDLIFR